MFCPDFLVEAGLFAWLEFNSSETSSSFHHSIWWFIARVVVCFILTLIGLVFVIRDCCQKHKLSKMKVQTAPSGIRAPLSTETADMFSTVTYSTRVSVCHLSIHDIASFLTFFPLVSHFLCCIDCYTET